MKLIILALSVIMLFGCSNSQQYSKPSSDAVKDTDSTWVEQIKDQITKELCKTLIDKDFKSRFGIRSNVLTIKDVGQSILGHDFIKAFVEGTMQGVIRGENNTYDFLVVIEFDEKDIASKNRIGMVQLHHKGKSDQFYDWANNVLLSDITIKSQYIYHGVTVIVNDINLFF